MFVTIPSTRSDSGANSLRTAKPPNLRNPREPLPTEEVFPSFGKSGCRDLNPGPVAAAIALLGRQACRLRLIGSCP